MEAAIKGVGKSNLLSSLGRVVQLSGFSDEVYAETFVTVSQTDVFLDILLVSQVEHTLQNVAVELCCSGPLKLFERPAVVTLGPGGFAVVKAGIKATACANGLVFGSLTYGAVDVMTVVLASISVDIVEFVQPKSIADDSFRANWVLLEWENKIVIPSCDKSPSAVLSGICQGAGLRCITPGMGLSESGEYLAANLFAVTIFGEEVLANICLEKTEGKSVGHLRLRSKTQGVAIALGDRITQLVS